jgi:Tol biopolymer transport system component
MPELPERFASLSRTPAPDLWSDIERREPREARDPAKSRRVLAAVVALVVAVAGFGFAAFTFGGSEPSALTGTSGKAGAEIANGAIAFTSGIDGYHIAAVHLDGNIQDLTAPVGAESDLAPEWSPDGRRVAFLRYTSGDYELFVAEADGSGVTGFDQRAEDFSWSSDGKTISYTTFQMGSDLDIFLGTVYGDEGRELIASPFSDVEPSWSPKGDAIAFVSHPVLDRDPGDADIFVVHPDGTGMTKLTDSPAWDYAPEWSPDSTLIAYLSERIEDREIFVMNADGSGKTRVTDAPTKDVGSIAWSPDGTMIAFEVYSGASWDIYVVNADGTGQVAVADGPQDEVGPEWSPDGMFLAYAVAESSESCQCDNAGSFDIYVMNPDGSGKSRLTEGAHELGGGLSWQPVID